MFCKTRPQLSLFDVNNVFPNALPKEDWCYIYRDQITHSLMKRFSENFTWVNAEDLTGP